MIPQLIKKYERRMNILLHSPLHIGYWVYLIKEFPEYNWFVEPELNFENCPTPTENFDLKVIPPDMNNEDFDVQIICLHLIHLRSLQKIVEKYNIPIVWIEYWKTDIKIPTTKIYPLISTCRNLHRDYPDIRFTYVSPSKDVWTKPWIGDRKEIFCNIKMYKYFKDIVDYLEEKKLPMKVFKDSSRQIPSSEWHDYYIHSRVFLEISFKTSSLMLAEAMSIGMPVVVVDAMSVGMPDTLLGMPYANDSRIMIRNGIDGFVSSSKEEIYKILKRFLDDYSFAKKMGQKAKERSKKIWDLEDSRKIWKKAFKDAITIHEGK